MCNFCARIHKRIRVCMTFYETFELVELCRSVQLCLQNTISSPPGTAGGVRNLGQFVTIICWLAISIFKCSWCRFGVGQKASATSNRETFENPKPGAAHKRESLETWAMAHFIK